MGFIVPPTHQKKDSGIPDWIKPEVLHRLTEKEMSKTASAPTAQQNVAEDVVYSYVCRQCNAVSTVDDLRRKARATGFPTLKCAFDGSDLVPHQVVKAPVGYLDNRFADNTARYPKDDRLEVPSYVPNQLLDKVVIHRMVNDVGNMASKSGMWDAHARFIRSHRADGPVNHIASAEIEITYTDQAQVPRTVRTAASVDTNTGKTILPSHFTYQGHLYPFTREAVDAVSMGSVFEMEINVPEGQAQHFRGLDPARFRDAFSSTKEADDKTLWDLYEAGYHKQAYEDIDPEEMGDLGEKLFDEIGSETAAVEEASEADEIEMNLFESFVQSYNLSPARRAYLAGLMSSEYSVDHLIATSELQNPLARFSGITKEAPSKEKLESMIQKAMNDKGWTREHAERYVAGGIWGEGKQGIEEGQKKEAKLTITAANMHRCYKCSKYDQNVDHPRNEAEQWQHAVCKKFDTHLGNVLWASSYPGGCELGEVAAATDIDPDYSDPTQVIASDRRLQKTAIGVGPAEHHRRERKKRKKEEDEDRRREEVWQEHLEGDTAPRCEGQPSSYSKDDGREKVAVDANFIESLLPQVAEHLNAPVEELGWHSIHEIGDALTDLGFEGLTAEEQEYLLSLIEQRKPQASTDKRKVYAKVPDFHEYISKHQTWDQLKNLVMDLAVTSNMPIHFDLKKVPTMSRDELEQRLTELMDRNYSVGIASTIPMLRKFGFEFYGQLPEGDYAVVLPDGTPEILTEAELFSFGQEGEPPAKRPSRYKKDIPKRHPTHPRTIEDAPPEMEAQLEGIEQLEERIAESKAIASRMIALAQEEAAEYLEEKGVEALDQQVLGKWQKFRAKLEEMQNATAVIKDRIFSSFRGKTRSPKPKPEAFRDALIAKFPELEDTINDLYKKARAYQQVDSFIEVTDVPEKTRDQYREGAAPMASIDELLDLATRAEDQLEDILEAIGD